MSNPYSITPADVRESLIDATSFDRLAIDATTGEPLTGVQQQAICDAAALEFASWLTGTFATAANLALAKPHVLTFAAYGFHRRRAANGDYKIPEDMKADYKLAVEWAKSTGKALLSQEGTVQVPGQDQIEYDADDAEYSMSQMDRL